MHVGLVHSGVLGVRGDADSSMLRFDVTCHRNVDVIAVVKFATFQPDVRAECYFADGYRPEVADALFERK